MRFNYTMNYYNFSSKKHNIKKILLCDVTQITTNILYSIVLHFDVSINLSRLILCQKIEKCHKKVTVDFGN